MTLIRNATKRVSASSMSYVYVNALMRFKLE